MSLTKGNITMARIVPAMSLTFVGTFTIKPIVKPFVSDERFVCDVSENARVRISYLDKNFQYWFLSKMENPFPGGKIRCDQVAEMSYVPLISKGVWCGEGGEVTLAEVFNLMELQSDGIDASPCIRGLQNVFFVPDVSEIIREVRVVMLPDRSWSIGAFSKDAESEWKMGDRVYTRAQRPPFLQEGEVLGTLGFGVK